MISKLGKKLKELVSGKEDKSENSRMIYRWVEREPRVKADNLKGFSCVLPSVSDVTEFEIANLSVSGIALFRNSNPGFQPELGTIIPSKIRFENQLFDVSLEVRRIEDSLLAFRFDKRIYELDRAIRSRFNVELAAMKMMKMRPELLKQTQDGQPHSFVGKSDCRLYYIQEGGQITRFEIGFFGHVIEGFRDQPIRFGIVVPDTPGDMQYDKAHQLN